MSKDFAEYERDGIYFAYPHNWEVQNALLDGVADAVVVTSPEGSFWLLAVYPEGTDPDATAKQVLSTMTGEYRKLESTPTRKYIGQRRLEGYEINFFYLDLTSTALVLSFEAKEKTYVIYWQTCDRLALTDENLSQADVFEAITHSFLERLYHEAAK